MHGSDIVRHEFSRQSSCGHTIRPSLLLPMGRVGVDVWTGPLRARRSTVPLKMLWHDVRHCRGYSRALQPSSARTDHPRVWSRLCAASVSV